MAVVTPVQGNAGRPISVEREEGYQRRPGSVIAAHVGQALSARAPSPDQWIGDHGAVAVVDFDRIAPPTGQIAARRNHGSRWTALKFRRWASVGAMLAAPWRLTSLQKSNCSVAATGLGLHAHAYAANRGSGNRDGSCLGPAPSPTLSGPRSRILPATGRRRRRRGRSQPGSRKHQCGIFFAQASGYGTRTVTRRKRRCCSNRPPSRRCSASSSSSRRRLRG